MNENPNNPGPENGDETASETGPAGSPNDPPRLTRPEPGRLILGVAEGLGRYFRIDPVFIRIGFIIAAFFGGFGLIAYLALALFTPSGESADAADLRAPYQQHPWLGAAGGAVLVLALIPTFHGGFWNFGFAIGGPLLLIAAAAVLFIALRNRKGGSNSSPPPGTPLAGPTAPREEETTTAAAATEPVTPSTVEYAATADTEVLPGNEATTVAPTPAAGSQPRRGTGRRVLAGFGIAFLAFCTFATAGVFAAFGDATTTAIVVAALGGVLIVAGFIGRMRWVAVPVLAAALAVTIVVASDYDFTGGVGDVQRRPYSVETIPADGYKLGVGRLTIDLRRFDWEETPVLPLKAEAGIGRISVVVPADVCVDAKLRADTAGKLTAGGEQIEGMSIESETAVGDGTPRLELDGQVRVGEIMVVASDRKDAVDQALYGSVNLREQLRMNRDACQGAAS